LTYELRAGIIRVPEICGLASLFGPAAVIDLSSGLKLYDIGKGSVNIHADKVLSY
jgi:hypothetical protein